MSLNITEEINIDAPAEAVWKVVGEFMGLSNWLPTTTCVEAPAIDGKKTRLVTMTVTGAKLVESLDEVNDGAKSIKFHVVESPFPIATCDTEMKVVDLGDGKSKFVWSSSCQPKAGTGESVKPLLAQLYKGDIIPQLSLNDYGR